MKRFVSIPILLALMLGGCTTGIPDGAEYAPIEQPGSPEVLADLAARICALGK